jgi:hypothetical protein
MRAFVIGDVHGHIDRLRSLTEKAGVVVDGKKADDVFVVQLGDLGHFGADRMDNDHACYEFALNHIDVVLWGNHDRAAIDAAHRFVGFVPPHRDTAKIMSQMTRAGRIALWIPNLYGYLLTHAGLHPAFVLDQPWRNPHNDAVNTIGKSRGGNEPHGGILWRDHSEALDETRPQIYGHTRGDIRMKNGNSYCIDVAGISDGNLAGIWLPDLTIVAVGEDAEIFEQQGRDFKKSTDKS